MILGNENLPFFIDIFKYVLVFDIGNTYPDNRSLESWDMVIRASHSHV